MLIKSYFGNNLHFFLSLKNQCATLHINGMYEETWGRPRASSARPPNVGVPFLLHVWVPHWIFPPIKSYFGLYFSKIPYKILFWDVFLHKITIKSYFGMYFGIWLKIFIKSYFGIYFFHEILIKSYFGMYSYIIKWL